MIRKLLAMAAVFMLVACASSSGIRDGSAKAVTATTHLPAPDSTSPTGAYLGVSDYRVGPLDLLEISVFQVEELNRTVRINSSGQISLPLIGMVAAGGRTVSELEALIADKLQQTYLQDPQVSVFVKEFSSQRITVEGAVNQPGIFPITGRTSLLQALALAKGFEQLAEERSVVIFRTIEGQRMAAMFDVRRIRAGEVEDPQVYGDDIIVVDRSGSRSALKTVVDSLRGFVGFRAL